MSLSGGGSFPSAGPGAMTRASTNAPPKPPPPAAAPSSPAVAKQWVASAFDARAALLEGASLRELITMFGLEFSIIWSAMLLKKRVVVVDDAASLPRLLRVLRTLPLLAWTRQDWTILRPYVTLDDAEVGDLQKSGVYAAGCLDAAVRERVELYDVLLDVPARAVVVADGAAKDDLKLGQLHKDVATFMVEAAEAGEGEQAIIKGVAQRTKKVTDLVRALAAIDDGELSDETLASRNVPPGSHRFVRNVALAEGLSKQS